MHCRAACSSAASKGPAERQSPPHQAEQIRSTCPACEPPSPGLLRTDRTSRPSAFEQVHQAGALNRYLGQIVFTPCGCQRYSDPVIFHVHAPMHLRKFSPASDVAHAAELLRHALQRAGSCGLGKAGHRPHSITKLGRIDYEVSYSSAGFDHFSSEIVARWNDGERRSRRCTKAFTTGRPPRSGERAPSLHCHADLRTLFGSLQPVCDRTPL
jgi:hypothetical protein